MFFFQRLSYNSIQCTFTESLNIVRLNFLSIFGKFFIRNERKSRHVGNHSQPVVENGEMSCIHFLTMLFIGVLRLDRAQTVRTNFELTCFRELCLCAIANGDNVL